jgi:PAS domain S-box-containing protein
MCWRVNAETAKDMPRVSQSNLALAEATDSARRTQCAGRLRKGAAVANGFAAALAGLALFGWLLNFDPLERLLAGWPLLRPWMALCLLLSCAALYRHRRASRGRPDRIAIGLNGLVTALLLCALLWPEIGGGLLRDSVPRFGAATTLVLQAAMVFGYWRGTFNRRAARVLAVTVFALALGGLLGVAFRLWLGQPPLMELSLRAAVILMLLAYSALVGRTDRWLVEQLTSERPGAILIRRLLPIVIVLPIVLAILRVSAQAHGLVDTGLGALLIMITTVLGFAGVVLLIARLLDRFGAQREAAQRHAQTQREWLRVTLTSISDAVIATDPDCVVRVMNPAAETLTGLSAQKLIGNSLAGLVILCDEHGEPIACPLRVLLQGDERARETRVFTLRREDEREIAVEVSSAPIHGGDGEVLGGVMVMRDISVRQKSELALRTSYAELDARVAERTAALQQANAALHETLGLFRGVADSTPDLIFVKDLEGRLVMANPAMQRALALDEAQMLGKTVTELMGDPTQAQRVVEHDQRVLSSGRVERAEQVLRTPEGARTFLASKSPLRGVDGEMVGLITVATDITDRKRSENDLREAQRFTQGLLDTAPLVLYLLDLNTSRIVFASGMVLAALGYNAEMLLGLSAEALLDLIHPEDRDMIKAHVASYESAPEGAKSFELRFRHRDGDWRWLHCRERLFDSASSTRLALGVAIDVTDRREAERELEQLISAEKRLRHEAEQANRGKDEFLAIVSHELRSPLNALRGWSFLLGNSRPLDPVLVERGVQAIKRNVDHQARLIDDLLDTSRMMSGKLTLEHRTLNLVQVLSGAMDVIRPGAASKRIELRFDAQQPAISIEGDAARLHQIAVNLLTNALKFTPEEGRIEVEIRVVNDYARFTVRDTGIGLDAEFLPRMFQRFSQADTSTTRRHGGLGIGLALVRHLAEMHNGRVWAESDGPGRGAAFSVELPLLSMPRAEQQSDSGYSGEPNGEADLNGLCVCALDDDPDARDIVQVSLRRAGASVHCASSGADLLAQLEEMLPGETPHVLLLDLAMPGEDGFSVLARVRELELRKNGDSSHRIPAIAVTAFTDINRARVIDKGFSEHVAKPFDPGALVATIRRVLAESEHPVS